MHLVVNNKLTHLDNDDPNLSVLAFLRTVVDLTGTKEGCASGDCGACTVLVGDGKAAPLAINACITPIGSLAGKYLYTVDGLANSPEELHPVQQAMVDCHGSQCGFCTPGFVMSLTGLYEELRQSSSTATGSSSSDSSTVKLSRQRVETAIAGNLCRCTGYRPILEAGQKMLSYPEQALVSSSADETVQTAIQAKPASPSYFLPSTEAELQSLLSEHPEAEIICGGTDLSLAITQAYQQFKALIDITRVAGLNDIQDDSEFISIGAACSYRDIETAIDAYSPDFVHLLHRLGSQQIRNRGSIGGNLANGSPIGDTPPMLMVWQSEMEIVDSNNQRRWLPVEQFYLGYKKTVLQAGEYIARIRIAKSAMARPHRFIKLSKRYEDDISAVMGAFSLQLTDGKVEEVLIAYGGVAGTPVRASQTENKLRGALLSDDLIDEACTLVKQEFNPLSDVRATADYRREMTGNLLKTALLEIKNGVTMDIFSTSDSLTGVAGHA